MNSKPIATCQKCLGSSGELLTCKDIFCRKHYHRECIFSKDKKEDFICTECQEPYNLNNDGSKTTSTRDTDDTYKDYYVEDVVGIRHRKNTREFKINWLNSLQETWEPESNLNNCVYLLNEFIKRYNKKNASKPNFVPEELSALVPEESNLVGASFDTPTTENWVTLDEIAESITRWRLGLTQYKNMRPVRVLIFHEIDEFNQLMDQILLLKFKSHCFVIYFNQTWNKLIIADGNNNYANDPNIAWDVQEKVRTKIPYKYNLDYIRCNFGSGADRCGAAAVLIGLAFTRLHNNLIIPRFLRADTQLRTRINQSLHPHGNFTATEKFVVHGYLECDTCSKRFKGTDGRKLSAHKLSCQDRQVQSD